MKRTNFLLTVACCILIVSDFCLPPIQGLQCYSCDPCPDAENPRDCKSLDLCYVTENKDGTRDRQCGDKVKQEFDTKEGIKCDQIHAVHGWKRCYCDTDLCNDNSLLKSGATILGLGYAKGHLIFIAMFVSASLSSRCAY